LLVFQLYFVLLVIVWCLQWYENILCLTLDESMCWHAWIVEKIWYSHPLFELLPRRKELAWARTGQGHAQVLFSSLFLVMVMWLIELLYMKHELCEYACIKWFMGWNWWVGYEYAYETWLDGWWNICMRLVCMISLWFGWWDMTMVWNERNSMILLVKVHGGDVM